MSATKHFILNSCDKRGQSILFKLPSEARINNEVVNPQLSPPPSISPILLSDFSQPPLPLPLSLYY